MELSMYKSVLSDNDQLRKDLAEREAECLKLRGALKTLNHNMTQALVTGNDRMREIQLSQVVSHEALSILPSTSYLDQWVADNFEVVAYAQSDPDDRLMLAEITKTEDCQQLDTWDKQMGWKAVPLYARKD